MDAQHKFGASLIGAIFECKRGGSRHADFNVSSTRAVPLNIGLGNSSWFPHDRAHDLLVHTGTALGNGFYVQAMAGHPAAHAQLGVAMTSYSSNRAVQPRPLRPDDGCDLVAGKTVPRPPTSRPNSQLRARLACGHVAKLVLRGYRF